MNDLNLSAHLALAPYRAYSYSYPHKTAYRPLAEPVPLAPLWAGERREHLFLYLHIPFCEMRCGFCNLFTLAKPQPDLPRRYVAQAVQQMERVAAALGPHRMARFAIGGGTPTYLETAQLAALIEGALRHFSLDLTTTPTSVEVSPETVSPEKLALLRQAGVDRISIGIQSFLAQETHALIRPQPDATVQRALDAIRDQGFPLLNLDLIYGIPGQTTASFRNSLLHALQWQPEELYLYPLYVRPQTGLGRIDARGVPINPAPADRSALYTAGRDTLLAAGYVQSSMRLFRRAEAPGKAAPVYCCQEDGMVGIGCGARSYTTPLHYASEYAVGRRGTQTIIEAYCAQPPEHFEHAHCGFVMDEAERRRRYVIQSLLIRPGLDTAAYAARFGSLPHEDFPLLSQLLAAGLAQQHAATLELTDAGLALSDAIGPALISPAVAARMDAYVGD